MAKHIDRALKDEPRAIGVSSGGRLARKYEYLLFYFLCISSWCLEIAAACLGSLYGGDSKYFIATIAPFMATHWYAIPFRALLPILGILVLEASADCVQGGIPANMLDDGHRSPAYGSGPHGIPKPRVPL